MFLLSTLKQVVSNMPLNLMELGMLNITADRLKNLSEVPPKESSFVLQKHMRTINGGNVLPCNSIPFLRQSSYSTAISL